MAPTEGELMLCGCRRCLAIRTNMARLRNAVGLDYAHGDYRKSVLIARLMGALDEYNRDDAQENSHD